MRGDLTDLELSVAERDRFFAGHLGHEIPLIGVIKLENNDE